MEAEAGILALTAPSGDLYWLLGLAILILLGVVIIRLVRIKEELHGVPASVARKLSGGEIARNLERIGIAASDASVRVQRLDDSLKTSESIGRWRDVMLTLLGTVIGLLGGFGAPWVEGGGGLPTGGQLFRAAAIVVAAVGIAFLVGKVVMPHIEEWIAGRI